MTAGLTVDGLVIKTEQECRTDINQKFYDQFGNSIDMSDKYPQGQVVAIFSEQLALIWELLAAIHASGDPDANSGQAQEAVAAMTGTTKLAAAPSTTTLTLTGVAASAVANESQVSNQVTGSRWETTEAGLLVALTAWAISTAYALGDRVSNGGNSYTCTTAGTSAGSGGPTTTADSIADGTAVWRYMGEGEAVDDVTAQSLDTGPIVGASGDLVGIESPQTGWQGVINLLDATAGRDIETAEELRIRREDERSAAGAGTIPAVRAKMAGVEGVTSVKAFWNNTDTTDGDGVPEHSVEFLIEGGVDQDIFDALLLYMGGGIDTHGDVTGTATDAEGNVYSMAFSRPVDVDIYVTCTVLYDAEDYPADGDDQIKAAISAKGALVDTGKDVTAFAIKLWAGTVAGVIDCDPAAIGTSVSPTLETTIAISSRQRAKYDTSRIVINSSASEP